jgi:hypothetical protein
MDHTLLFYLGRCLFVVLLLVGAGFETYFLFRPKESRGLKIRMRSKYERYVLGVVHTNGRR